MKKIVIFGSTGSIGRQTADIILRDRLNLKVYALTANKNVSEAESQARIFKPEILVMNDSQSAKLLRNRLKDTSVKVFSGKDGIEKIFENDSIDIYLNATSGFAGLLPSYYASKTGKRLCTANKESIITAGDILFSEAAKHGTEIIPVDSEHCAIHQCLKNGKHDETAKVILTASGGPFRNLSADEMQNIRPEDALKHPTWQMGNRITIDSATLMNKGFEVIEAAKLFSLKPEEIEVVVHPQSIIHSMVEFRDGVTIAQIAEPDMRYCIKYALTYPRRTVTSLPRCDLVSHSPLTFEKPDYGRFPLLRLAYDILKKGGASATVLNAADETAVGAFMDGRIKFTDIFKIVEKVCDAMLDSPVPLSIKGITEADKNARAYTQKLIEEN